MRAYAWSIVQAAVAAGIAWFLAHTVLGHPQPFFAPIAAVVALAAGTGGRGTQAVQMLLGVAVGVVVGELLVLVLGTGTLEVPLAAAATPRRPETRSNAYARRSRARCPAWPRPGRRVGRSPAGRSTGGGRRTSRAPRRSL